MPPFWEVHMNVLNSWNENAQHFATVINYEPPLAFLWKLNYENFDRLQGHVTFYIEDT